MCSCFGQFAASQFVTFISSLASFSTFITVLLHSTLHKEDCGGFFLPQAVCFTISRCWIRRNFWIASGFCSISFHVSESNSSASSQNQGLVPSNGECTTTLSENQKPQQVKKRKGRRTFGRTRVTNMWWLNQTWKPPKSFWLQSPAIKVQKCHNRRHRQQFRERFSPAAGWGPPAVRCSVADWGWGIRSLCRAAAGTNEWRLLFFFYLKTTRELRRKNVRSGQWAARLLTWRMHFQNILFHFGLTDTVQVYTFGRTRGNTHARICRLYKSKTMDRRQNSRVNPPDFPRKRICGTFHQHSVTVIFCVLLNVVWKQTSLEEETH